ncbi:hypothetical protein PR048_025276 [Dryococelus australis]|uniref:Uncharacterized protein n=1 Tax=Dryococelus australis TaxID=614101 RepID=A0ABQ9GQU8_9NEOP|nr:hypothetical protein PR048_025276 [Dryococelus australis]
MRRSDGATPHSPPSQYIANDNCDKCLIVTWFGYFCWYKLRALRLLQPASPHIKCNLANYSYLNLDILSTPQLYTLLSPVHTFCIVSPVLSEMLAQYLLLTMCLPPRAESIASAQFAVNRLYINISAYIGPQLVSQAKDDIRPTAKKQGARPELPDLGFDSTSVKKQRIDYEPYRTHATARGLSYLLQRATATLCGQFTYLLTINVVRSCLHMLPVHELIGFSVAKAPNSGAAVAQWLENTIRGPQKLSGENCLYEESFSSNEALRSGPMHFVHGDRLKEHTEICKDSSTGSQRVLPEYLLLHRWRMSSLTTVYYVERAGAPLAPVLDGGCRAVFSGLAPGSQHSAVLCHDTTPPSGVSSLGSSSSARVTKDKADGDNALKQTQYNSSFLPELAQLAVSAPRPGNSYGVLEAPTQSITSRFVTLFLPSFLYRCNEAAGAVLKRTDNKRRSNETACTERKKKTAAANNQKIVLSLSYSSHLGEPGSISRQAFPKFSRVGIVPDDAAGRRVFSVFSRFPHSCILVLLHTHLASLIGDARGRYGRQLHARLGPHRSYAQGVQCFRRNAVLCKLDLTYDNECDEIPNLRSPIGHANLFAPIANAISPSLLETRQLRELAKGKYILQLQYVLVHTAVADLLSHSPPTKANRVQYPAGSQDFPKWESCRTIEVNVEQRWNVRAGETGVPLENPTTNGNVRHVSHMLKYRFDPAGYENRFVVELGEDVSMEQRRNERAGETEDPRENALTTRGENPGGPRRTQFAWVDTVSTVQRHDGNTACLAPRSDEELGVRVSVARIAPSLLDLRRAGSCIKRIPAEEIYFNLELTHRRLNVYQRSVSCVKEAGTVIVPAQNTALLVVHDHIETKAVLRADGGDWVSMEKRRNERVGETGNLIENPPNNGIVRHDSHLQKSGVTRPAIEPESLWWEASRGRGGVAVRLLATLLSEPGSISSGIPPGFLHVGIVPDDFTGRPVFSGISRFPCPCVPSLLYAQLASPSSALKMTALRAAQISPLDLYTILACSCFAGHINKICFIRHIRRSVK